VPTNYFKSVLREARKATWDLVFADRPVTVIIATGVTCLAIYMHRQFGGQSSGQTIDALVSIGFGLAAYGLIFALVFFAHFCYFTPKHMLQKATQALAVAKSKKEREQIRSHLCGLQLGIEDRIKVLHNMTPVEVLLFDNNTNATTVNDNFVDDAFKYVTDNVGLSHGGIFLMDSGLPHAATNSKYGKHLEYLLNRAFRLKQIIDEYKID
jgi:hypothetical protein